MYLNEYRVERAAFAGYLLPALLLPAFARQSLPDSLDLGLEVFQIGFEITGAFLATVESPPQRGSGIAFGTAAVVTMTALAAAALALTVSSLMAATATAAVVMPSVSAAVMCPVGTATAVAVVSPFVMITAHDVSPFLCCLQGNSVTH
jgi:hypothetical protein